MDVVVNATVFIYMSLLAPLLTEKSENGEWWWWSVAIRAFFMLVRMALVATAGC